MPHEDHLVIIEAVVIMRSYLGGIERVRHIAFGRIKKKHILVRFSVYFRRNYYTCKF